MGGTADVARVPRRRIGTLGPEVSVLSLGSWHIWDRVAFDDAVELVRDAVDAGINLFDVGVYGDPGGGGPGAFTDILFGRIIQAAGVARDDWVLSEKLWLFQYPRYPLADQLDRALTRVGTDYADFAILGDITTDDLDIPRLVRDLGELLRGGRLRGWGVNNWRASDLRAAWDAAVAESIPPPQMAQLKYSVCRRSIPEGEPYRRLFADTGITLEASSVLEGGILAGKTQPARPISKDPGDLRSAITTDAAPKLAAAAESLGATPAQAAVAFCLAHPSLTTVLFGASTSEQLTEAIGAVGLLERHGADRVRAQMCDLWLDRDVVDPNAGWSTS